LERALEQACHDLQQAHNEILRGYEIREVEWKNRSWPQWSPQANTIRWAEELLGKPLGKNGKEQG
jgi:hypothetical protein